MDEELNTRSTGTKRWVRVLLGVSLAFNLLVVGAVGGAMLSTSKWRAHHPPRLDMAAGPLTQALSREDRRAIGWQMRKTYRKGGTSHAGMRAEFEGLAADLKAVPFDPDAVIKRLQRQRAVFEERLALGQSLLLERLTQMPPAERAAYADRLLEAVERHGRHDHHGSRRQE